ncbi:DUF6684 family protein [Halorussus salinus]|uniref:DUF6684 family protein n=1 Tax=Halorussus salinus TaxID=1364935 RepID=UPI001EE4A989|nr:DUF6684 family protein [Halorussus salinus]
MADAVILVRTVSSYDMSHPVFNRETLLDISVNIIPLVILLFFTVFLLVFSPWPQNTFLDLIALGLHIIPFVLLALLTYIAAYYI